MNTRVLIMMIKQAFTPSALIIHNQVAFIIKFFNLPRD